MPPVTGVVVNHPKINQTAEWYNPKEGDTWTRTLCIYRPGHMIITNDRTGRIYGPYEYVGADYRTAKIKYKESDQMVPYFGRSQVPVEEEKEIDYGDTVLAEFPGGGGPKFYSSAGGYRVPKEETNEKESGSV
jgi:hypothetical protein